MGTVTELTRAPRRLPRVQLLRNMAGWTQLQLAELASVDPATVRRWERGTESIPREQQTRLAELFGISEFFVMGGIPDQL